MSPRTLNFQHEPLVTNPIHQLLIGQSGVLQFALALVTKTSLVGWLAMWQIPSLAVVYEDSSRTHQLRNSDPKRLFCPVAVAVAEKLISELT